MGKSGHIARKIAATLASTGTPAQFVHPAEASHGDLGMILEKDCVLAISRSGETAELSDLLYHCRRMSIPVIGMTFKPGSSLANASTAALVLPECGEASEDAPAPTTSTTMCLALGDALAVALIKARGFSKDDFGAIHPGGKLGAALKRVRDIMRVGGDDPLISPATSVSDTMKAMSVGGIGAAGVVENGKLGRDRHGWRFTAEAVAGDVRQDGQGHHDGGAEDDRAGGADRGCHRDHERKAHHAAVRCRRRPAGGRGAHARSAGRWRAVTRAAQALAKSQIRLA